jgi:hypothetical protein
MNEEEFTIKLSELIKQYPNDMELGSKIRMYYLKYGEKLKIVL